MTDYYTCGDCGGYIVSCGCMQKRDEERRASWAAEYLRRKSALDRVRAFLDENNMSAEDREAFELVHMMAWPKAHEALRFSKK